MSDSKYSKGKIYAIRSKLTDNFYIGSTCKTLEKRFGKHKSVFTNYKVGDTNYTSFIILANGDAYIELIEDFPSGSRKELERREGELILKHKDNVVNKNVAGRTKKETKAEYYKKNKAKLSTKHACECGGKYIHDGKARHLRTKKHQTYIASLKTIDTTKS
jgi:hypothetical protein